MRSVIRQEQAAHTHCSHLPLSVSLSLSLPLSHSLHLPPSLQILVNRRSTVPKGRLPFVLVAVCRKSTRSQRNPPPPLELPAATPVRACGSDKGRPACCNAALGFALVYLLMVYLLIPADYHVRQGRKRDTARGRHRKRICQEGWRRGKVLGQGWQCWALDKAYRVLDNCG